MFWPLCRGPRFEVGNFLAQLGQFTVQFRHARGLTAVSPEGQKPQQRADGNQQHNAGHYKNKKSFQCVDPGPFDCFSVVLMAPT